MYKKTMTYEDYNGNERTEDFYFNLTEAEITELEMSRNGGFTALVQRIVQTQDAPTLVSILKEIIAKSYGVKSDDGKRFEKSPELLKEFSATEAYSQLFMELAFDDKAAAVFVNNVIPKKYQQENPEALLLANKQN